MCVRCVVCGVCGVCGVGRTMCVDRGDCLLFAPYGPRPCVTVFVQYLCTCMKGNVDILWVLGVRGVSVDVV